MGIAANWLKSHSLTSTSDQRRVTEWERVQEKPSSIKIKRNGAFLPNQLVRIEYLEQAFIRRGSHVNEVSRQGVVIQTSKDYPTIGYPDIQRGDRFYLDDVNITFEVIQVDFTNDWLFSATALAIEDH